MTMNSPTLSRVAGGSFANLSARVSSYFSMNIHGVSTDERMQTDLRRLAELSPHLLADLGFVQDRKAGAPGRQVWRKDEHCVTLHVTTDRVAV